jgi:pyridoxal phosphate enzyme (YggS family)
MDIPSRVNEVRRRIAQAAARSGRTSEAVRLVAVTKYRTVDEIVQTIDAGVTDIGENRIQEAGEKRELLGGRNVMWHLVGHLQSNKAKRAVGLFDWIDSLHSLDLARRVNRLAEDAGKIQRVLVQVDLAHEETKSGLPAEDLFETIEQMSGLPGLRVEGLMVLPPFVADPEAVRPYFVRLRELLEDCHRRGVIAPASSELSMGMSHDFDVAVEEGATMVRIGTALFGERPASRP